MLVKHAIVQTELLGNYIEIVTFRCTQ